MARVETATAGLPTDTVAFWMFVSITVVIGLKVITGSSLNRKRKALATIHEKLRDIRIELEHASERTKAAGNETSFQERRMRELAMLIDDAQMDLAELASSESGSEPKESGDPQLPRHMRPRGEDFLEDEL
jgi:chromosome segregation ATPase